MALIQAPQLLTPFIYYRTVPVGNLSSMRLEIMQTVRRRGEVHEVNPHDYRRASIRGIEPPGESVRIIRELQDSQNKQSKLTSIPQSTISAIERDRINLLFRVKVLRI